MIYLIGSPDRSTPHKKSFLRTRWVDGGSTLWMDDERLEPDAVCRPEKQIKYSATDTKLLIETEKATQPEITQHCMIYYYNFIHFELCCKIKPEGPGFCTLSYRNRILRRTPRGNKRNDQVQSTNKTSNSHMNWFQWRLSSSKTFYYTYSASGEGGMAFLIHVNCMELKLVDSHFWQLHLKFNPKCKNHHSTAWCHFLGPLLVIARAAWAAAPAIRQIFMWLSSKLHSFS